MEKKYLAKIIAKDQEGLKLISACCFGAKVKISNLKYLKKNKIFLVYLERFNRENQKDKEILHSICKFEYVENVKSKNIDQNNKDLILELFAIDLLKNNDKLEINLMFNDYSCITLFIEITEVTLENQNKI